MKPENIKSWITSILSVIATVAVMLGVDEQTVTHLKEALGTGLETLLYAVGLLITAVVSIIEVIKQRKNSKV